MRRKRPLGQNFERSVAQLDDGTGRKTLELELDDP